VRWARSDRGSVTAELAVALPAVVVVIGAVLLVVAASTSQMRCADAARAGARAAAIGETDARVREIASHVAGDGTAVTVARSGPWVTVTTSRPVGRGPLAAVPLRADARATARVEP
jgi:hypothetical protein